MQKLQLLIYFNDKCRKIHQVHLCHICMASTYGQQSYKLQMKNSSPDWFLNIPQYKWISPTTIIQAVVDGDLCCIAHCSVTTLSTIEGQWDNENTFIKIIIHFSFFNSIQFTSNSLCFTSGLPKHVCVLHTQGYSVVSTNTQGYSVVSTDTQGYSVVCKHAKHG